MDSQYHKPTGRPESLDLDRLGLVPGAGGRLAVEVRPGGVELGGQRYEVARQPLDARLDLSRTAAGYALRLRFEARLEGPCVRCLEAAEVVVPVDAREVDQPGSDDAELTSPYVEQEQLDLARWAHDALVLALPAQFLCRSDCAGLCPVCGVTLNDADPADHRHESEPDPRWAKLREIKLD